MMLFVLMDLLPGKTGCQRANVPGIVPTLAGAWGLTASLIFPSFITEDDPGYDAPLDEDQSLPCTPSTTGPLFEDGRPLPASPCSLMKTDVTVRCTSPLDLERGECRSSCDWPVLRPSPSMTANICFTVFLRRPRGA